MTDTHSTQPPLVTSPYLAVPPKPPVKKKRWFTKPVVFLPVGALVLGAMMGSAGQPEAKTVEVIKEVPGPERTVTKEVKVNVPTTPAACLDYITYSEQGFSYAAESMGAMNEALQAAGKLNVAGINAANAKLEAINPKFAALSTKSNAAKAECLAAK